MMKQIFEEISAHIQASEERYGDFASTHEALGVALEEWEEMKSAIRANAFELIRDEAIDLAAVLIRLADQCRSSQELRNRSVK